MAIAPLYFYNIAMTIVLIGGVIGLVSIVAHHYLTNGK